MRLSKDVFERRTRQPEVDPFLSSFFAQIFVRIALRLYTLSNTNLEALWLIERERGLLKRLYLSSLIKDRYTSRLDVHKPSARIAVYFSAFRITKGKNLALLLACHWQEFSVHLTSGEDGHLYFMSLVSISPAIQWIRSPPSWVYLIVNDDISIFRNTSSRDPDVTDI